MNEDDTSHRLIKTFDEGRVYIRIGNSILESNSLQMEKKSPSTLFSGLQDLGKITVWFDNVNDESDIEEDIKAL